MPPTTRSVPSSRWAQWRPWPGALAGGVAPTDAVRLQLLRPRTATRGYDLVTVSAHKLGARRARCPRGAWRPPRPAGLWGGRSRSAAAGPGRGRRRRHGRGDGRRGAPAGRARARVSRARDTAARRALAPCRHHRHIAGRADPPGPLPRPFPGIEQEELLVLLDDAGVCASAGSACASGALERAMCCSPWASTSVTPHGVRFPSAGPVTRRRGTRPGGGRARRGATEGRGRDRVSHRRCQTWAMRVLVAMSGGVALVVAAALMVGAGHDVVGATLKLWVARRTRGAVRGDVDDARRVAQQLGIAHHVFNLAEDFDRTSSPRTSSPMPEGRTAEPCIECNRHIKFDALLARARASRLRRLARPSRTRAARCRRRAHRLLRRADPEQDQSYVLPCSASGPRAVCSGRPG